MNDDQITALAREYAEEEAKGTAVDALPNGLKENVIQRNADHFEKHLRWLLRRYCLVEKSKVIIKYKNMKRLEEDATAFGFEAHSCNAKVVKNAIESLFPEIAKEVEG